MGTAQGLLINPQHNSRVSKARVGLHVPDVQEVCVGADEDDVPFGTAVNIIADAKNFPAVKETRRTFGEDDEVFQVVLWRFELD
jgi:outer membrane protein assembly factor BamE (lipoprotein component of BamABCDE complex)